MAGSIGGDGDNGGSRLPGVITGNASADAAAKGWFVGHFLAAPGDPRATTALEVKWAVYGGGEERAEWGANREATTLAILVRGCFRLRFPNQEIWLEREGDFALWQPGVRHHWQAVGPTVVLTVRWPSLPGDSVAVADPAE